MKGQESYAAPKLSPEAGEQQRPGLTVHVVRHGPAAYGELAGIVPGYGSEFTRNPENALDLSLHGRGKSIGKTVVELENGIEAAVAQVEATACEIAETIEPDEEVVIWSSGTARTLHTARIIRDVLRERGIKLRERGVHKESQIQVFDQFNDIRNFNYKQFVALADGGELDIDGTTITLDKAETNPDNLGYTEYYSSGAVHNIPEAVKSAWPEKLKKAVAEMEDFESVSTRVLQGLKRVSTLTDKKYRLIIVSHGSPADQLVRTYKPEALTGINPAEYVTVERNGDKMVVTHAGAFTDGDSTKDIFEKFEEDKRSGKIT